MILPALLNFLFVRIEIYYVLLLNKTAGRRSFEPVAIGHVSHCVAYPKDLFDHKFLLI